jgi:hypothetical protein
MAYNPKTVPPMDNIADLQSWVTGELEAIAAELQSEIFEIEMRQGGVQPKKPREGMLASADNVGWVPGGGPGLYEYKGGVWVKL